MCCRINDLWRTNNNDRIYMENCCRRRNHEDKIKARSFSTPPRPRHAWIGRRDVVKQTEFAVYESPATKNKHFMKHFLDFSTINRMSFSAPIFQSWWSSFFIFSSTNSQMLRVPVSPSSWLEPDLFVSARLRHASYCPLPQQVQAAWRVCYPTS